jgi:predicted O-methyltransferase YrrM
MLGYWFQRRVLLERQLPFRKSKRWPPLLEPSSAEFIAALAAGINSRHTLQVGCGLSTVALAAAARATGSCVLSLHHEKDKQRIVQYVLKELGLSEFVEFITEDPASFIAHREGVEFVLLSGVPERYIQLFDLLKLRKGAVVVADNALDDATNDYIRHVRRQPGVESSTLPLNRGIEVTKIVCWEDFQRGRKIYSGIDDPINNLDDLSRQPGLQGVSSNAPLSSGGPFFSQATADTRYSSQRANLVLVESKQKTPSFTVAGDSQKPSQKPDKCHDLDESESCRPLTIQQHESDVPETSQQGELREFKDWNKEKAAGMDNTSGKLGKLDEHERTVGWEEISWNSQVESSIGSDQRVHPLEQDTSPSMQSPVHQPSVNSTACSDPCTSKLDKEHPLQQSHSNQWHESEGQGASSLPDTMTSIVSGLEISEDTAGSYSLATYKFVADAVPCQPSAVAENEGVRQVRYIFSMLKALYVFEFL